jgi:cytoskeletal protein CcmA (bactofilin family)
MMDQIARVPVAANDERLKLVKTAQPSSRVPAAEIAESVIGNDLTILGDGITIISKNRLRIEGRIRGDVAGKEVMIGPEGSVSGTVSAETVEVLGEVQGSIHCIGVKLHETAHVDAEIVHETMVMEKGAYFDGKVRRLSDRKELLAKLDPNSYLSEDR